MKLNAFSLEVAEAVVVAVSETKGFSESLVPFGVGAETLSAAGFKGKAGESLTLPVVFNQKPLFLTVVGFGPEEKVDADGLVTAFVGAINAAKANKLARVSLIVDDVTSIADDQTLQRIFEGLQLSTYTFEQYKAKKEDAPKAVEVSIHVSEYLLSKAEGVQAKSMIIAEGVTIARDLVNEPANIMFPERLASDVLKLGKTHGFDVSVMDLGEIRALKMDAFLAVAEGSEKEPKFIVMRHMNKKGDDRVLGLVGKGLTYDSGGYAIKPADGMVNMKNDMGGSAAVIGAMTAIARLKLEANVVAVVAACENMISGNALKNGDIISSMAGKTIEVANTDAEGRLTLADAVHYVIEKEKASHVLDIATLTGAALVATGVTTAPVVSNDDDFFKLYETAAKQTGEKVWRFPADEDYKKLNHSHIADLKNIGGRFAGTITAGLFIGEFVQAKPWIHVDIAGVAWTDADSATAKKGGTGFGVKSLVALAESF